MNYRHLFHAGNFADVHKHVVLLALIERLTRKPKPILLLDTHAGRGMYDLRSTEAARGNESQNGIRRLLGDGVIANEDVKRYLGLLAPSFRNHEYLGSPLLAAHALRAEEIDVQLSTRSRSGQSADHAIACRKNTRQISVLAGVER